MVGSYWETLEEFWSGLDTKQKKPMLRVFISLIDRPVGGVDQALYPVDRVH